MLIASKSKLMIGTYTGTSELLELSTGVGEVDVEADDEAHDRHHRPLDRCKVLHALVVLEDCLQMTGRSDERARRGRGAWPCGVMASSQSAAHGPSGRHEGATLRESKKSTRVTKRGATQMVSISMPRSLSPRR